jgi:hypothetical protein
MIATTLTEIIFRGKYPLINPSFLLGFLRNFKESRFNFPEKSCPNNYEEIVQIIRSNSYFDFVITVTELEINGFIIPNVFINLGLEDKKLELFIFCDLKDFKTASTKESVDKLKVWTKKFKARYGFERVICQMDNGSPEEFYFDDNGDGPLYNRLDHQA